MAARTCCRYLGRSTRRAGGTEPSIHPATNTLALSLGVTGYWTDGGFKVTSVCEGSLGADIFLRPGDVISKIDDRQVKDGQEIESAVAATATGTIKVTGLTQTAVGMVTFERGVKLR